MSGRPKKAKPWEKLIDEFLESVPSFEHWKSLAESTVLTSISGVVESNGGGGQVIQHMERYTQQSQVIEDEVEHKARELIFLASCAVLARWGPCDSQEVDSLVRTWYHYPSLAAKTVRDRYNGMKWIGKACSALYPHPCWGRKCHDMFVLCECSDFSALPMF